ncbi:hypothetical protein PACTADRAFT_42629 [Pachysolen tannophilus NRRL Y-2460]|uniref:Thioesterase domain-containing protein n=1 Tax=Pachysolen tannophilus NRRL Y-2460 TaxID=669874 RepID=A0A1E4TUT0_PACTA|nr:hypothetical protein PACTADRAFT_42629 [Pachysolen tannophilus NRRL Y-2460]
MSFIRRALVSGSLFSVGYFTFAEVWGGDKNSSLQSTNLNDKQKLILSQLNENEHFKSLLANDNFIQNKYSSLIPKPHQKNYVSQGLLFGPNHLEIDPILFRDEKKGELIAIYHFGSNLVGNDNTIHCGLLSTILDESLCTCGFPFLPSKRGVTARLSIKFNNEIILKSDSTIMLKANVREFKGRKVIIDGYIETLDLQNATNKKGNTIIAKAECILVEPKWFKYFNWVPVFEQAN